LQIHIGSALVDRIEEQQFPVPLAALTRDQDFIARRIAPLPDGFCDRATGAFLFSNHSWLIRVDGLAVLVDPCNGNGRTRRIPTFDQLDAPYLERLAASGVTPAAIDVVFCTHLHNDHCGWNTQRVDDRWLPTFPNAQYVFAESEYRRWDPRSAGRHPNDFNESVFDECVQPVVDAGQARIVPLPHAISPGLTLELAPGHTLGHSLLRLDSGGARAYFTGDVFHHPAQLTRPELHLPGCDDLQTAIATRRALVSRIHGERALLFPAHFAPPHYGALDQDADEIIFVPGEPRLLPRAEPPRPSL
jgi:glyoxylase-like metal-dependent hydrolase (beta-lactamase superfamily II)